MNEQEKENIRLTTLFFEKRFPDKDISFEMKCGYFWEWVSRIESENPTIYMDEESLKAWEEI